MTPTSDPTPHMNKPAGLGTRRPGRRALLVAAALGLGALGACSVTTESDTQALGDDDGTEDTAGDVATTEGSDADTEGSDNTSNSGTSDSDSGAEEDNDTVAEDDETVDETDGDGDVDVDDSEDGDGSDDAEPAPAPDPPRLGSVNVAFTTVGQLDIPIAMATRAGSDDLYIAQQNGEVRVLEAPEGASDDNGAQLLDLRDDTAASGERGLLGIAFSPDGRRLYASYTDSAGSSRIDEFTMDESTRSERVDLDTRRNILTVEQPFGNHNGGDIHFGPDGYLYIGLGDGGAGGDPLGSGQDRTTLLGTVLRIDPDIARGEETGDPDERAGARPYDIPADNPFVDDPSTADEIWIYGARNPWRFAFDDATGDLWIADVGQSAFEEINHLPASDGGGKGANLGWNAMEGSTPFDGGTEPADHTPPIFEYGREDGCSVTGGIVYRGEQIPALDGFYLYGDYCKEAVRALRVGADGTLIEQGDIAGLSVAPQSLISFGVGPDGEAYALLATGEVQRIDNAGGAAADIA